MNKLSNISKFTVTQLNNSIKNLIENNYEVINIVGETFQVKKHSSGHIYFSLKDDDSIISAICWRSTVPKLSIKIDDGIKVIVKGRVTTYHQQSRYQIIVQNIEFEGEGSYLKLLEERKKKLMIEGFFDLEKKKKLPKYPNSIGIITSESGVVIKDIIHRISDRFPSELIIFPANVQGKNCLSDIVNGINFFNQQNKGAKYFVDFIIIARGGGSLEDLMPFNEESLVKAVFNSSLPIVSAVGHETDYTLCDLASDFRAPTPSAAAEMTVPDRNELILRLGEWSNTLKKSIIYNYDNKLLNIKLLASKIPNQQESVNFYFQELDQAEQILNKSLGELLQNIKFSLLKLLEGFSRERIGDKLKICFSQISNFQEKISLLRSQFFNNQNEKISSLGRQLSILSYKQTLNRGFAVIRKKKRIICDDLKISKDDILEIEFYKNKTNVKKI